MTREEAIENIKKALPLSDTLAESFYTLHPELRESEDERIRQELIEFVDTTTLSTDERHYRWIAYLEKQKAMPRQQTAYINGRKVETR